MCWLMGESGVRGGVQNAANGSENVEFQMIWPFYLIAFKNWSKQS